MLIFSIQEKYFLNSFSIKNENNIDSSNKTIYSKTNVLTLKKINKLSYKNLNVKKENIHNLEEIICQTETYFT